MNAASASFIRLPERESFFLPGSICPEQKNAPRRRGYQAVVSEFSFVREEQETESHPKGFCLFFMVIFRLASAITS
jgi:hypothetical protein